MTMAKILLAVAMFFGVIAAAEGKLSGGLREASDTSGRRNALRTADKQKSHGTTETTGDANQNPDHDGASSVPRSLSSAASSTTGSKAAEFIASITVPGGTKGGTGDHAEIVKTSSGDTKTFPIESDQNGRAKTFSIRSDYTITSNGIVSLGAASEMVRDVQCIEGGQVRIKLDDSIDPLTPLEAIFPISKLLTIPANVFGPCRLLHHENDAADASQSADRKPQDDGCLFIESVSGSPQDALISGEVASCFFMFEKASFSVRPEAGTMDAPEEDDGQRELQISDFRININETLTFFDAIDLGLQAEALADLDLGFDLDVDQITRKVGFLGIPTGVSLDLSIKLTAEVSFDAEISMGIRDVVEDVREERNLFRQGISDLGVVIELPTGLPDIRLGGLIELDVMVEGNIASATSDFQSSASVSVTTGRYELSLSVSGRLNLVPPTADLDFDTNVRTFKPAAANADAGIDGDLVELDADLFVALVPKVTLTAIGVLEASTPISIGQRIVADVISRDDPAFLPPLEPNPSLVVIGSDACRTCHRSQIETGFVVDPKLKTTINLGLFDSVSETGFLTNVLEVDESILQACYLPVYGGDPTPLCGDRCCNPSSEECVVETTLDVPAAACLVKDPATPPPTAAIVAALPASTSRRRRPMGRRGRRGMMMMMMMMMNGRSR